MMNTSPIKPSAPVVCATSSQFTIVDPTEGTDSIRLEMDEHGIHRFPITWVTVKVNVKA